jgi:hypothetical protein
VKRAIAILLLSIYMFSFVEFHQFLRIPLLIQHFVQHRQQDPSISFMAFIRLHYVGQIVIDDDYQQDKELPFRETDCCVISSSVTCECPATNIEIARYTEEINNEFVLNDEDNHSFLSVADIFQPPRVA